MAQHRREVSRLEGFSDGVFAFGLTLLVVSLEVPNTFDELAQTMRQFFAFAVCFALLFQVWWRHFNFFRRYGLEDNLTIALTGVLLFVVLFYVYPLKFVATLVINQLMGFTDAAHVNAMITRDQAPRLMQIYSGGVIAVFSVFTLLYANAYRKRDLLSLDGFERLDARVSVIDNLGLALIGVLSFAIATFGGPLAASRVAGPIYFLIGPFKGVLGWYAGNAREKLVRRINTTSISPS